MADQVGFRLAQTTFGSIHGLVQPAAVQVTPVQTVPYYSLGLQARFPAQLFKGAETLPEVSQYADVGYEYDEQKHLRRTEARLQAGCLRTDLPTGWPRALSGPLVWTGSDYADESLFVYTLSDSDNAEILEALRHFKGLGIKGKDIRQSSFPLPNLGKTLSKLRHDIYHGRGFATLRGFKMDALSPVDVTTAYLGLTSYIAEKRGKQNQQGTMMINVVNTGEDVERANAQIVMVLLLTPDSLHLLTYKPFHTDLVCDTLSMLTLSSGPVGGSGILASAWTVYNELAQSRPDLIRVLSEPDWPFDTHGRDPPYYKRALLYYEDGKVITNYSRRILCGEPSNGPRTPGIPGLTEAQAEAIDALHAIGRRHELKQSMEKGDIRFVNNLAIMHRRDPYGDTAHDHRHLLRLWLHSDSQCWKLPLDLQLAWERVFNDHERQEEWHLVQYSPTGEQHVVPVWDDSDPRPPPGPPPVTRCD